MTITLNGTTGIVNTGSETITGALTAANFNGASTFGFKNRIINGAMMFSQRNGTTATANGSNAYTLDRWAAYGNVVSKYTTTQSTTAPDGFSNSLLVTSSSAYSVASGDYFFLIQRIEANNVFDFSLGTANAKTFTLSFWVRSSLTGTFGGSFLNSAENYSYPFTYTISSANTWEQKTLTVAGPTAGTWATGTSAGLEVSFGLGVGSSLSGTAGSWAGSQYYSATGGTSVVGTNGATFYITGVQLETGTVATSFDYRPYGTEMQLCLRYFAKSYEYSTANGTATYTGMVGGAIGLSTCGGSMATPFPVLMRIAPTMAFWDGAGNASKITGIQGGTTGADNATTTPNGPFNITAKNFWLTGNGIANYTTFCHYTATAEL